MGHVDTWTAWVNGTNQPTIDAADFIGVDAYPYFQDTMANSISSGPDLFNDAISSTQAAVGGKPVWITETGWPVSGDTRGQAAANVANAKTYYDAVGCSNFGKVNIWWYTSEDTDGGASPNPSFGLAPGTGSTTPLYDLSCADVKVSSSSTSKSATSAPGSSATGAAASSGLVSSVLSSASTAATAVVSSSGSLLSPSQSAGSSSSGTSVTTGSGSVPTGSTSLTTSGTAKTGLATPSSSAPAQATGNSATTISGSLAGVMGAMLLAVAAL